MIPAKGQTNPRIGGANNFCGDLAHGPALPIRILRSNIFRALSKAPSGSAHSLRSIAQRSRKAFAAGGTNLAIGSLFNRMLTFS
jgi:hypothetical protein